VALVVAQNVPTSSSMAVPHGPAGVGEARHRMRAHLRTEGVSETVIDDAVLILSELLSNACKHGRPLGGVPAGDGDVRATWRVDTSGRLVVEVTDGGGPTRPAPSTPSVTAHGGRGLNIITALADDWGVRDDARGEVTVWVVVHDATPGDARGAGRADSRAGSRTDLRAGSGRGLREDPVRGELRGNFQQVQELGQGKDLRQVQEGRQDVVRSLERDRAPGRRRTGLAARVARPPGSRPAGPANAGDPPKLTGRLPDPAGRPPGLPGLAGLDFTEAFDDLD
jgi:anti-sigma regulatory factor (Ser/Thr protein kinase)